VQNHARRIHRQTGAARKAEGVPLSLASEEREYFRKAAQFARANKKVVANARVDTVMSGLQQYLHSGSEPMKMFNAEFKRRRLAGLTKLRYGAAKKRFENHLAERLIDGLHSGDLKAAIETALSQFSHLQSSSHYHKERTQWRFFRKLFLPILSRPISKPQSRNGVTSNNDCHARRLKPSNAEQRSMVLPAMPAMIPP
jgi:hypothetical protein